MRIVMRLMITWRRSCWHLILLLLKSLHYDKLYAPFQVTLTAFNKMMCYWYPVLLGLCHAFLLPLSPSHTKKSTLFALIFRYMCLHNTNHRRTIATLCYFVSHWWQLSQYTFTTLQNRDSQLYMLIWIEYRPCFCSFVHMYRKGVLTHWGWVTHFYCQLGT